MDLPAAIAAAVPALLRLTRIELMANGELDWAAKEAMGYDAGAQQLSQLLQELCVLPLLRHLELGRPSL